jgi:hypothetical protein
VKPGSRITAFQPTDWFFALQFMQFGNGAIINTNPSLLIQRTTIVPKIIWK